MRIAVDDLLCGTLDYANCFYMRGGFASAEATSKRVKSVTTNTASAKLKAGSRNNTQGCCKVEVAVRVQRAQRLGNPARSPLPEREAAHPGDAIAGPHITLFFLPPHYALTER